jgi:uncharacterized protein (DUF2384 family)
MSTTIQEQKTKTADEVALDSELAATFSAALASRWLETPNPILGGDRPVDCLERREYDRVHAALEAFNTGVYI